MPAAILRRTREMLPLLRLAGFDTSTPEGRARERLRRVTMSAAASAASRVISIGTSLLTVPLTFHYLGTERYGLWLTLTAVTTMLSFADFGIGNGVLSAVATAHGRNEEGSIRSYVSSAFALLTVVAVVILAGMAALYGAVDWARLFNVHSALARAEVAPAVAAYVTCFALAMPFSVVARVQQGMQMGFVASLWQCMASIAGLIGVLVVIWFQGGLPWLVIGFVGLPLIVGLLNSAVFFGRQRPDFRPRLAEVSRRHGAEVAEIGWLFFVLQLAVAVTYSSDNFVISHILGADQVPVYAVPDRIFAFSSIIVGFAVTPLWPAFGEAIARGDYGWAKRILWRATVIAGAVGGTASLVFLFTGRQIIHLWVGDVVRPSFLLLAGFALWRTLEAAASPMSMYLNGLRSVRFQATVALITAFSVIIAEVLLIRALGVACLPWITATIYLILTVLPCALFLTRHFARVVGGGAAQHRATEAAIS